jgi:flagellar basal body-associated protein FliL
MPVLSLIALIKVNEHLKKHFVTIEKTKKQRKNKESLFTMINVLILASMVGYMVKYEWPQKEHFYKNSISKKQKRIDQENFLLSEFTR